MPTTNSIAAKDRSGIIINHNTTPASSVTAESSSWFYQEFRLPSNYERGTDTEEWRRPDLLGFQVLVGVTDADHASLSYTLDIYDVAQGWTSYASGVTIGSHAAGDKVWFDVYFNKGVIVTRADLDARWRIGVKGRTASAAITVPVTYDDTSQGTLTVNGTPQTLKLAPRTNTPYTYLGEPAILFWDNEENEVTLTYQHGVSTVWRDANGDLCYRILGASGDEGIDALGNVYRSVVVNNSLNAVATTNQTDNFWLSKPNPSKFAVETLYFDVSSDGKASVVDSVLLDPLTPGMWANVYYSSEGAPGTDDFSWENKLWTHTGKPFHILRRDTYVLPEPITARYICVEFSHLQGQHYSPGGFVQPIRYKKHPKWVLDYFLLIADGVRVSDDDFVANTVNVAFDSLDLAYNYYVDDLQQAPLDPAIAHQRSLESIDTFFTNSNDASDQVDSDTLRQIDQRMKPYLMHPTLNSRLSSLLGATMRNMQESEYSIEAIPAAPDLADDVSSLDRDALVIEQNWPVMFFYVSSRHKYREVLADLENDRAYFAGIREIAFQRQHYATASDSPLYIENTGDDTNVFRNDFVRVNNTWHTK